MESSISMGEGGGQDWRSDFEKNNDPSTFKPDLDLRPVLVGYQVCYVARPKFFKNYYCCKLV